MANTARECIAVCSYLSHQVIVLLLFLGKLGSRDARELQGHISTRAGRLPGTGRGCAHRCLNIDGCRRRCHLLNRELHHQFQALAHP